MFRSQRHGVLKISTAPVLVCLMFASMFVSPGHASAEAQSDHVLAAGEWLETGDELRSPSGEFRLVMQHDGNLVVYQGHHPTWSSDTQATSARLAVQSDGNVVVYAGHHPVWNSGTQGRNISLVMQDDGNLVIYSDAGAPMWDSGSAQAADPSSAGSSSDWVRGIQTKLRDRGYEVEDDGYWGPKTVDAVANFQADYGLPQTGEVGPETEAAFSASVVEFVNPKSGKCLDVPGQSLTNGLQLQIFTCNGSRAQRFELPGDGTIRIGEKCVRIEDDLPGNGIPVVLYDCHSDWGSEQWSIRKNGHVRNTSHENRCLDVTDWGTTNGTKIQAWPCKVYTSSNRATTPQEWSIRTISSPDHSASGASSAAATGASTEDSSNASLCSGPWKYGCKDQAVSIVQSYLSLAGYPVSSDAVWGPETENAVRAFQADHGLDPDGMVGPKTLEALEATSNPQSPPSVNQAEDRPSTAPSPARHCPELKLGYDFHGDAFRPDDGGKLTVPTSWYWELSDNNLAAVGVNGAQIMRQGCEVVGRLEPGTPFIVPHEMLPSGHFVYKGEEGHGFISAFDLHIRSKELPLNRGLQWWGVCGAIDVAAVVGIERGDCLFVNRELEVVTVHGVLVSLGLQFGANKSGTVAFSNAVDPEDLGGLSGCVGFELTLVAGASGAACVSLPLFGGTDDVATAYLGPSVGVNAKAAFGVEYAKAVVWRKSDDPRPVVVPAICQLKDEYPEIPEFCE